MNRCTYERRAQSLAEREAGCPLDHCRCGTHDVEEAAHRCPPEPDVEWSHYWPVNRYFPIRIRYTDEAGHEVIIQTPSQIVSGRPFVVLETKVKL